MHSCPWPRSSPRAQKQARKVRVEGRGHGGDGWAKSLCACPVGAGLGGGEGGSCVFTTPPPPPGVPSCGDKTGQHSRAPFPRNLQPWSQRRAVVLGGPHASVTPVKSPPVQPRAWLSGALLVRSPVTSRHPKSDRFHRREAERTRRPGCTEKAAAEAAVENQGLKPGMPDPCRRPSQLLALSRAPFFTGLFSQSPSHHWQHQQVPCALVKGSRTLLILQMLR